MAYQAEIDAGAKLELTSVTSPDADVAATVSDHDVCLVNVPRVEGNRPPYASDRELADAVGETMGRIRNLVDHLPEESAVGFLVETELLPYLLECLPSLHYQRSVAVRLEEPIETERGLDDEFRSVPFFSKGYDAFSIAKVRTAYRYCPVCEKTTKDYGGKKHLYHSFGTLQRDVWKHPDVQIEYGDPLPDNLTERVRATFSSGRHSSMVAVSSAAFQGIPARETTIEDVVPERSEIPVADATVEVGNDRILQGDALDLLARTPSESADLVFLDPPYNIGKEYENYDDARDTDRYYQWCEEWLEQVIRVLAPGGVAVGLNLPEAIAHHYRYLGRELDPVNWICWDALSRPPAGNIMPTNYPILVFSKGDPQTFNYEKLATRDTAELFRPTAEFEYTNIYQLDDNYCKRTSCKRDRERRRIVDRKELTSLWTDVFRLKHNSKREDHPTMLPPKLVRRLIWLFTETGDAVLDPFNGVGTTTLTAAQLDRRYTGFEISERYVEIAREKHDQLDEGLDPFEKQSASIAPPPSEDTEYKVPKRDLQLEVKRLAEQLGHVPDKEEVEKEGRYPIKYYEEYFDGWADATKAARTTGMTEDKETDDSQTTIFNYSG